MEICSGRSYESVHPKPGSGSYEWWYFDGWDEKNQTGFVLIFYEGNPFSSRYEKAIRRRKSVHASEFPAVSLSVYHRGEPVYYSFDEVHPEDVSIHAPAGIRMAGCRWSFTEEEGQWINHLELNHRMPNGDSLTGSIHMRSSPLAVRLEGDHGSASVDSIPTGNHRWNPVQPDACIHGELSITGFRPLDLELSGRGYHDHNVGCEPMANSFERWYWGRFHLPEQTLIYYLMRNKGRWERRAWLLSPDRAEELSSGSWSLDDFSTNWFGLAAPRRLRYEDGTRFLQIDQSHQLDDGPFYQRYASRLLYRNGGVILQSEGISETILPGRIGWRWVRPLVDMRIRYPDRVVHWVQRSPRLYRWTW